MRQLYIGPSHLDSGQIRRLRRLGLLPGPRGQACAMTQREAELVRDYNDFLTYKPTMAGFVQRFIDEWLDCVDGSASGGGYTVFRDRNQAYVVIDETGEALSRFQIFDAADMVGVAGFLGVSSPMPITHGRTSGQALSSGDAAWRPQHRSDTPLAAMLPLAGPQA